MSESVGVLAMHAQMHTLFPNPPRRWRWISGEGDINSIIEEHGSEVEVLLSASIEKLDKDMLSRFPKLRMIASISAGFAMSAAASQEPSADQFTAQIQSLN